MTEQREGLLSPAEEVVSPEATRAPDVTAEVENPSSNGHSAPAPEAAADATAAPVNGEGGTESPRWQARAGRKGAERVHQLIEKGRLYEQEHGLKRGRQRLRQLIELGKLYEAEHGLRPARAKKRGRLSRVERDELLATLLHCLVRLAKSSFREELERLVQALPRDEGGRAA
jgi:hypothetical protein